MKTNLLKKITLNTLTTMYLEEKKDFQDLNNAGIMKANLLKKITLNTLIMTHMEEKRDLVLNLIELTMINQEEKRDLGLKSTVGEVKIEPFKQCQKDIVENHLKIAV